MVSFELPRAKDGRFEEEGRRGRREWGAYSTSGELGQVLCGGELMEGEGENDVECGDGGVHCDCFDGGRVRLWTRRESLYF